MPESTDPAEHPQSEFPNSQHASPHRHRPGGHRWSHQAAPSRPFGPTDPFERLWNNAALRIAGRATVHAVRETKDRHGNKCPAPACHTGHDQYNAEALEPVYDKEITCKNCNRNPTPRQEGRSYDPGSNQMVFPGFPPLRSFPPPPDDAER